MQNFFHRNTENHIKTKRLPFSCQSKTSRHFAVFVVVVVAAVVVNDTILDRLDKILMHLSMFSPRVGGGGGQMWGI